MICRRCLVYHHSNCWPATLCTPTEQLHLLTTWTEVNVIKESLWFTLYKDAANTDDLCPRAGFHNNNYASFLYVLIQISAYFPAKVELRRRASRGERFSTEVGHYLKDQRKHIIPEQVACPSPGVSSNHSFQSSPVEFDEYVICRLKGDLACLSSTTSACTTELSMNGALVSKDDLLDECKS